MEKSILVEEDDKDIHESLSIIPLSFFFRFREFLFYFIYVDSYFDKKIFRIFCSSIARTFRDAHSSDNFFNKSGVNISCTYLGSVTKFVSIF